MTTKQDNTIFVPAAACHAFQKAHSRWVDPFTGAALLRNTFFGADKPATEEPELLLDDGCVAGDLSAMDGYNRIADCDSPGVRAYVNAYHSSAVLTFDSPRQPHVAGIFPLEDAMAQVDPDDTEQELVFVHGIREVARFNVQSFLSLARRAWADANDEEHILYLEARVKKLEARVRDLEVAAAAAAENAASSNKHSRVRRLTPEQAESVRAKYTSSRCSYDDLAQEFGVSQGTISRAVRGVGAYTRAES